MQTSIVCALDRTKDGKSVHIHPQMGTDTITLTTVAGPIGLGSIPIWRGETDTRAKRYIRQYGLEAAIYLSTEN